LAAKEFEIDGAVPCHSCSDFIGGRVATRSPGSALSRTRGECSSPGGSPGRPQRRSLVVVAGEAIARAPDRCGVAGRAARCQWRPSGGLASAPGQNRSCPRAARQPHV